MSITQVKGDTAVSQAIASFTKIGYYVSIPLTESAHYDLIVDDGELHKVQCKYTSQSLVDMRRIHSNSKGYVVKKYPERAFDWLYVLNSSGYEYLFREMTGKSYITLRDEFLFYGEMAEHGLMHRP